MIIGLKLLNNHQPDDPARSQSRQCG